MKGEKEEMSRMSKKRKSIKSFSIAGLFIMIAVVLFTMTGCSDDKATSITNPEATTFEPKGTIQGVVRDSVTLQPIVGAKVSVGVQEATTDANGQYVIRDVPATTDALNGTVVGTYQVTVDLKNVTSPVNMTTTPAPDIKYPEVAWRTVSVSYTSLDDTSCDVGEAACTNSTNHDTSVDALVGSLLIAIGKLDANIEGVVAGCDSATSPDFFESVGAGYKVELFTVTSNADTGSGASGHLIGSTTTDADGEFAFNNVEANLSVMVMTTSPDGNRTDTVFNTTPSDGRTLKLTDIQASVALHACSTDIHGPRIIAVSPEAGSDQSAGNINVALTFSEPVRQTAFTSTEASGVANLYDYAEVMFDGTKAGNVAYSMSWNSTFDILTVTIPNAGISSLYHVRILNIPTVLTDAEGNGVDMGVCPDDSASLATPYGIAVDTDATEIATGVGNDCLVYFTTKGSTTPAAPSITLVNESGIDEGSQHNAVFDWAPTSGAKDYNVYCRTVQMWGTTEQTHAFNQVVTGVGSSIVSGSSSTVDFDAFVDGVDGGAAFVENSETKLAFDCKVTGVSADGVEGIESNIVRVEDKVGPELVEDTTVAPSGGSLFCGTGVVTGGLPTDIGAVCDDTANPNNITKIILGYNEEMDEVSTEATANYVFSGLAKTADSVAISTTTAPVYNPATDMILLTLSDTLTPAEVAQPVVKTGNNGLLETTANVADFALLAANAGIVATDAAATGSGVCVHFGPDFASDTTVGTGDVAGADLLTIRTGTDGDCDSTANSNPAGTADDIQVVAVGERSGVCVIEGGTDVTQDGDDVDSDGDAAGAGMILTGVNGVCDTDNTPALPANASRIVNSGSSTPNAVGIIPGADYDLDTTTKNNVTTPCTTCDDDISNGTKITVSNVKDVAGITIKGTKDVFRADGNVLAE